MKTNQSNILTAVHETATGLHQAGVLSQSELKAFDILCNKKVNGLLHNKTKQQTVRQRRV